MGSNTSCQAHICGHYQIYKEWCEADRIKMKEHCIPHKLLKSQSAGSGVLSQMTPDNAVELKTTKEFSKDGILHAVAQLVACDDQVSDMEELDSEITCFLKVFVLVTKTVFRNCLLAM